jgi:hypothetical protein
VTASPSMYSAVVCSMPSMARQRGAAGPMASRAPIAVAGAPGEQLCWSELRTGVSARTGAGYPSGARSLTVRLPGSTLPV